jgi:short-subunit dehydrogenase
MSLPLPAEGSTALVTGASSGIGEQFARRLSARGHHVTLVARSAEKLEALAAELGNADARPANLADAGARDLLAEAIERDVEILVNCAGFGVYLPFYESPRDREIEQVRLLVEAVVDLMHRYLPGMVRRRRGAIINLSSTAGFQALPYNAGYAAAKSHTLLLSEGVSAEVDEYDVTVTAVCPGPVPTHFQQTNDAAFSEKLPKPLWVSAERVAEDSLRGAERGQRVVIPGGAHVRAAFAPNRYAPRSLALAVAKRVMAR